VVDCANGAAYHIAPHVFHELGAEVISIGNQPNGRNINAGYGATAPEKLVEAVKANGADLGLAFDGDADRLQVVDADGRLYNGDELLYLIVRDRQASGQRVEGAVGTLMTNMAVELALKRIGVSFVRAKVGDRYVLEELNRHHWQLGGEGSGHLLCLDRHTTGDGIVSALQVLAALRRSGKTLPQLLDGVAVPADAYQRARREGLRLAEPRWTQGCPGACGAELEGRGRVLIRASGTEPVVRVMVEAEQVETAERAAQELAAALRA
jgi:phosphoglucosamine mutase